MQAACQGHEIIVHTLLNQGADREIVSRLGDTAQSLAKKKAYHKIMTLLDSKSPNHSRLSRVTQPTSKSVPSLSSATCVFVQNGAVIFKVLMKKELCQV